MSRPPLPRRPRWVRRRPLRPLPGLWYALLILALFAGFSLLLWRV